MAKTKIGINGFGRIGRQVLRSLKQRHPDTIEVAAINDVGETETNAHLLKFDSTYGRYPGTVECEDDSLIIDGVVIACVFKDILSAPLLNSFFASSLLN